MTLSEIVTKLNNIAWGPWMLILLVGTGVYLSIRMGFLQFRKFGYAMKNTLGKLFARQKAGKGEVTPLQAVSTALAATVGTGNIAGVTGAIAVGGPGAVFWMWISALFGMLTKYSEVTGLAAPCTISAMAWVRSGTGLRCCSACWQHWLHLVSAI